MNLTFIPDLIDDDSVELDELSDADLAELIRDGQAILAEAQSELERRRMLEAEQRVLH